jgi:diguanylate cyclase (GGDEF)-like protein/PAS domain S-box-containing protein
MKISLIPLILLFAGIFTIALGIWSLRYMKKNGSIPFAGLMLCSAIHSIGYSFELSSLNLHDALFWSGIQYIGISFLPMIYLAMAISYTGKYSRNAKLLLIFMALFGIITLGIHNTTEQHGYYYRDIALHQDSSLTILTFTKGVWYVVNAVYLNLSILAGSMLFLNFIFKAPDEYKKQAALMLAGSLSPWLGYAIYLGGLSAYNIDLTPIMLTVASPIWALALFKYRLFDLSPVARDFIFESMTDGMIIVDSKGRLVDFNNAASRIFSHIKKKSIGKDLSSILAPYPEIISMLGSSCKNPACEIIRETDNRLEHFRVQTSPLTTKRNGEIGKIIALMNTTEQAALMEELQKLATTDELTGILNRREFISASLKEINRAKRFSRYCTLIMFDIDYFKSINDIYGHNEGDRALKHIVNIVKDNIREIDIFGRYGGEEFTLLLPEVNNDAGIQTAERLRSSIEKIPLPLKSGSISITASFGVAVFHREEINLDELIRRSDEAMYQAKAGGRNRTIIYNQKIGNV